MNKVQKDSHLKAKQLVSTLVVALACATAQVHSATPAPELPLSLALKAAQATLAACADPLVTVTVTDREGVARVVLVGDAAGPVGIANRSPPSLIFGRL